MVAAVAALRVDPRLNASSVTDWYGDFRAWCHKTYDGLHLCRNTMTAGSAAGEAGFLTPRSFEGYLSLFIAGNQQVGGARHGQLESAPRGTVGERWTLKCFPYASSCAVE